MNVHILFGARSITTKLHAQSHITLPRDSGHSVKLFNPEFHFIELTILTSLRSSVLLHHQHARPKVAPPLNLRYPCGTFPSGQRLTSPKEGVRGAPSLLVAGTSLRVTLKQQPPLLLYLVAVTLASIALASSPSSCHVVTLLLRTQDTHFYSNFSARAPGSLSALEASAA